MGLYIAMIGMVAVALLAAAVIVVIGAGVSSGYKRRMRDEDGD